MRSLLRLFLAILAWGVFSSPAQAALELVLRQECNVAGRQVLLRDVVETPTPLPAALGDIVIATLVRTDQAVRISAPQVQRLIERQAPGMASQVRLTGANAVTVTLPGVALPEHEIQSAARDLLKRTLQSMPDVWVIDRLVVHARSVRVPQGQLTLQARLDRPLRFGHPAQVAVAIYVDGRLVETVPVGAALSTEMAVLRSKRALSAGEVLSLQDIETSAKMHVAWEDARPLRGADVVAQRRMKHSIAQGEILRVSDVEPAPLVGRAQEIVAERRTQHIVIEKRVVAEADAWLGARVKVTDPGSGASFYAKVIAPGRVEVQ